MSRHSDRAAATKRPLPPGFFTIWTTVALDLVGFGIVAPLQGLYVERLGASPTTVGFLFASFSLAQFVFALFRGANGIVGQCLYRVSD